MITMRRMWWRWICGITYDGSDLEFFCTHAQVCANNQVIRATSPHTAPVCVPCHSHGAATPMRLGGNLGLWRRGRWWWRWNWNIHRYRQFKRQRERRLSWSALKYLFLDGSVSQTSALVVTDTKPTKDTPTQTHLALWAPGSARSCSDIVPAPHTSAAGKQTARSPVWLEYRALGTHPRSRCQQSCWKRNKLQGQRSLGCFDRSLQGPMIVYNHFFTGSHQCIIHLNVSPQRPTEHKLFSFTVALIKYA